MSSFQASAAKPFLFAGPTLVGLPPGLTEPTCVQLEPPAIRGDIDALIDRAEHPGTIILADGCFHSELSVGHAELRRALNLGWEVWGVSSMGAIRAYEMRFLGMKGFGQVYKMFCSDPEFSDDEVALLHFPGPSFASHTEPLVHIRMFLPSLVEAKLITAESARVVLDSLKSRWFGDRSLAALGELLTQKCGLMHDQLAPRMATLPNFRIKTIDLARLLRQLGTRGDS